MSSKTNASFQNILKKPKQLSPRISFLRDYYFLGTERSWNNEFTSWSTGTDWDVQFNELTYYIVPETYELMSTIKGSFRQAARNVSLPKKFWTWSLPERRAWFVKETMVNYVPQEILPGDLIAGGRFNLQTSMCLTKKEQKEYDELINGENGVRQKVFWFHNHGYGNAGATSGHLIPNHERLLKIGFKGIFDELEFNFNGLSKKDKKEEKGQQLKAMMTSSLMPKELASKYADHCIELSEKEESKPRKQELLEMASNLKITPWNPPKTFWQALQALWINHMLVMSDENYPGPGVSFGRFDQYLYPFWKKSIDDGMDREFGKEILKCFFIHCNTAYDAMIRSGNQGISAGFGQLITLSGMGKDCADMTNDLTYALLEVIDDMSPLLEPKPNVRLHRNSPEKLLNILIEMISTSQGAPFLLNFDERSMAGMLNQAKHAQLTHLINKDNVFEYAPVGCLENTMVGNDRSGTVDNNINLIKAVELALTGGKDLLIFRNPITGKKEKIKQDGPETGDSTTFETWEKFFNAYKIQTQFIIKKCVDLYETSETIRSQYFQTPYLSCLVEGCAKSAKDITQGGAEISFSTIEAVTYATTVDSLLAIKYLVFDEKKCTMKNLIKALKKNWDGHEVLQAIAKNKTPKYGRDDNTADDLAIEVMNFWCDETWKHKTKSTLRQFRPGMLSWNYWVSDAHIVCATPDGRKKGQFLSNAICPTNGADIFGPTANTNSVGKVLGGKTKEDGDYNEYNNVLPNGASHTITFNYSNVRDQEHKMKLKAFLKGYIENGGTALQINMLNPEMLKDAQKNPEDYRHLLVRITGYNAYFTSIGKELQDEVINRLDHEIS